MDFGERIRATRRAAGLAQVDLSKSLGVAVSTISNWENNVSKPSLEMIELLCGALGVSPNAIIAPQIKMPPNVEDTPTFEDEFVNAVYIEAKGLTPQQKQTVLDMIRFLKNQKS